MSAVVGRAERALLDVERARGLRSLSWFIQHAFPIVEPETPYCHNWHIDVISGALQALRKGEIRKLIINVPPGSMKSLQVSVFFNVWTWINNPAESFLYTSFDGGLTFRDAGKVRTIMESEWFLKRWGHLVRVNPNEATGDFSTWREVDGKLKPAGGWRFSTSVDGKTTGRHPGIRVIDDPTKPRDVNVEALEKTNHWWQSTFRSRGDQRTVRTCLIMQRLAENDLAGYFQAREGNWVTISIPLEYKPAKPLRTPWGDDPRTVEGETFYRSRFPPEVVREIKIETTDVAVYSSQYDQDPVPPGGIVFNKTWFEHTYEELPEKGFGLISLDCTFKDTEGADRVAMQYWWISSPRFYLVDRLCARLDFVATCDQFAAFCAKHPKAIGKLIEDKANGSAVISTFKRHVSGIIEVSPLGGKRARAVATTPLWQSGAVYLPTQRNAPWVVDYKAEHVKFPRGEYDDEVDATSQLLAYAGGEAADEFGAAMKKLREYFKFAGERAEGRRR